MIKLITVQSPNPKYVVATRKYYLSTQNQVNVTLQMITESISDRCTLTEKDVLAALNRLQRETIRSLMDGKFVRFGTFWFIPVVIKQ